MKKDMTGIILAGGKNSHMGTNKAFLEIDGIRLIDNILYQFLVVM
jgi:molybdopterin-guanine dinucleotide biosynthesis protein A